MTAKIAADVGHGFVKALSADGRRAVYPSLISPAPVGPDLGSFSGPRPTVVNGRPYLIGENARFSAASLFSRDKATDPLTLVLSWAAAAKLLGAGYHTVSLGVGLPLSWYASQKAALSEALRRSVTVDECHLAVESVAVFPQGVGALLAAGPLPDGLVGLVDIGYRTVDYLVAQVNRGLPSPVLDRSGTWAGGMHVAYQAMSQALENATGVRFEPHELLDREFVTARGQRVDLTAYRAAAFEALAADLARHLAAAWDGVVDKLDTILLAGGGALALSPYMSGLPPTAVVVKNSQWANAVGYLGLMGG